MKKNIIALIMIALLGVSAVLTGCNGETQDTNVEKKGSNNQEEANKENTDDGKKESAKIVMGTNAEFPPFEYVEANEVVGFDVDLSQVIAEASGQELVVENMAFDSLIPALQAGKIDFIAAGMTVTDERKEQVNFSDPYFVSTQVIIVNKNNDSITKPEDLEGKKIGVQIGTTGEILAKDIEGTEVSSYNAAYAAVMDLMNGKIDAVIVDQEPAGKLVANNEGTKILDQELSHEEYAIAVPKDKEELLKKINEVLAEIKENGEYDKLYNNYFTKVTAE